MKNLISILMLASVACGGGGNISDCDPCLSAVGARSGTSLDGNQVTCSCAQGSGQQSYPLVLETTTTCADSHTAWLAYSSEHCR